jgi:2-oxo-4-hydroxy-4-carboxy-5-ureidoimidazoline decarboxylase
MAESELNTFNLMTADQAAAKIRPSCASDRWLAQIVKGRPYRSLRELQDYSDHTIAGLGTAGLKQALDAHPRIGARPDGEGTEAEFSRQEQSGAVDADQLTARGLRQGNLDYEQRFGQVFLICATGRSAQQLLAALRERLGNDPVSELEVVRVELAKIVGLRLAKTFEP